MAKRGSSGENDPFDLPDDDFDNLDMDVSDLKIEDTGEVDPDLLTVVEAPATTPPLTIGSAISGIVKVILIAALVVLVILAVGFGIIFGGQRLGIVPTRANATLSIASLSNLLPSQLAPQETAVPQNVATSTPTLPTLTPDLTCASATTWWNSQQISDNYDYFSIQAVNEARDSARLAALLEQMRIRRDFVANFPADSCASEAKDALLRAFDATIDTARIVSNGDQAAFNQKQGAQAQAYARLTAALWAVNVNLDGDSAPARGVARNSGASCGAEAWYGTIKPHEDTFFASADQIDLTTMPESAVRPLIDTMQTERDTISTFAAPVCASHPQTLLLGTLDAYIQALEQQIDARSGAGDYSAYAQQHSLFLAWMYWLGVS